MFKVMVDGLEHDRYHYLDEAQDVEAHLKFENTHTGIEVYIEEVEDED